MAKPRASFSLDPEHLLALAPGKKPFHTLNPAAARLADGRTLVYGSMGGDGQPQTQATIFTRYVLQGVDLQEAICAPRWLLGRTWGQVSDSLKLENRFSPDTVTALEALGHEVETVPAFSEIVGHAGASSDIPMACSKVRGIHAATAAPQAFEENANDPTFF
ncbi:Putative gamma-glutamyltransferase ywrD [Cedecea neteri]|uniref:Gamma-glutamyltransferase ywrD n=1 Tax=Cedecea neteri TaxID=158822 RepID=A0A2X2V5S5_9ENTR|nr:Putative gamma-glutamyltransferase ywrD [Cedecea neteri]